LELFGIHFLGLTDENARKLIASAVFLVALGLLSGLLRAMARWVAPGRSAKRVAFWFRQVIRIVTAAITIFTLISIWFSDATKIAAFLAPVMAGIAFAMQKVVTAVAAYFVLLRGKAFNVGDRIKMGGVRGDVIALGFIQTTIMEMGPSPAEQSEDPEMCVLSRQYSGRIVTVTNDKIFDEPVYNYSRDFPFVWEEMHVGIAYQADLHRAEQILLDAAWRHTKPVMESSEPALDDLERRYSVRRADLRPCVFWRMTDKWLEMSLRFIAHPDHVRDLKDRLTRTILTEFGHAHLQVASGTYEIVGMPKIDVRLSGASLNGDRTPAPAEQLRAH
jgi:small-conductance mechanosensitive channel